ncbi:tyrosine-protein phosphatase required for protection against superoxide stress (By similarity) [Tritrichomonas musculus]|uniref:protein-tyrosine-phosphatase n=1 Tax=Tritrichomonas musculus TaxID=1915356 RepID=A0ABR2INM8_9EUKA
MHRTGTVIGCFRKLQNWSLSNIIEEFRRYTGLKPSSMHEQFIELFDTDLVKIPSNEKDLPFAIPMSHKHQSLENDY